MKSVYPHVGLERICKLFGKTRQGFYDHNHRQSNDQMQQSLIIDLVKSTRQALPNVGGLKLLHILKRDLATHRISIGRDSFFALLKSHDLLIRRRKRYVITTNSNHPYKKWQDLIKGLQIKAPEQLWVSDITYLRTENGFIYLSLITDAYSRKIVGYHLSQQLRAQGCLVALHKAISSRTTNNPLIHHSDRGIQYCCEPYVSMLQRHGISISMTQSGSPYDNALAERVNGILKTELNLHQTFAGYSAAVPVVHQAIDAYNRLRPHMSLDYNTPQQAHQYPKPFKNKHLKTDCKAKSVLL
jgi:putative transposase